MSEHKVLYWVSLVTVILLSLLGFHICFSILAFLISVLVGILTVIYFLYDEENYFKSNDSQIHNPLDNHHFSVNLPIVLKYFEEGKKSQKFDQRITGCDTVDTFLNDIIKLIIGEYVAQWYEILTDDDELQKFSIKKAAVTLSANIANRVKCVDWTNLLSVKLPEELITQLKLFKQARVRFKHVNFGTSKESLNTNPSRLSPKRGDDKKGHKRNKSDTDIGWLSDPQAQIYGKSKFYGSNDSLNGKTLTDIFFNLESSMEDRRLCRDIYCTDSDKENVLLNEVSEALIYLLAPEEVWKCNSSKFILRDILASVVIKPLFDMITDPDNINRLIISYCWRDTSVNSELFLSVIRSSEDIEELDATFDLVQREIQKLHSRDTGGECELGVKQQLSSLEYLTRVIKTRRASLSNQYFFPRNNSSDKLFPNETDKKLEESVKRALQFLSVTTTWRSNTQYLIEIELSEQSNINSENSTELLQKLRSSALELCDNYLAPNKAPIYGVPDNTYDELVNRLTSQKADLQFDANPAVFFEELHKCIFEALEDVWQGNDNVSENSETTSARTNYDNFSSSSLQPEEKNTLNRHNRSHSDVGAYKKPFERSDVLNAVIIEAALHQEKGKIFGTYAISVKRLSDGTEWHIYRRYSDFHDLHTIIKEMWPELSHLPFPGKKTFQNTSRALLEKRKVSLNRYLQNLTTLARETRYQAMMDEQFLGGFLNPQNQSDRHANTLDAMLVSSLRAGMRTLKNMPDQLANTVDGVMDGISKVFLPRNQEDFYADEIKYNSSESQLESEESVGLRLLEEILGVRGLWLRRTLLAPLRTILADRIHKKILELVATTTSTRSILHYLKYLKNWLASEKAHEQVVRDSSTKARSRVAAKVALLAACADDLRPIVGQEASRRGMLTLFESFQKQEINKRLVYVLLEATLINLFPDNDIPDLFKKMYAMSPKTISKKSTLV